MNSARAAGIATNGTVKALQKSLRAWTRQKWRTASGKPSTQGSKATGERYLPEKAIKAMSASQYAASTAAKTACHQERQAVLQAAKSCCEDIQEVQMTFMHTLKKEERPVAALFVRFTCNISLKNSKPTTKLTRLLPVSALLLLEYWISRYNCRLTNFKRPDGEVLKVWRRRFVLRDCGLVGSGKSVSCCVELFPAAHCSRRRVGRMASVSLAGLLSETPTHS